MVAEVLATLKPRPDGRYADGTLGGAGHAAAILAASSPTGWLSGCDRDGVAVETARARLAGKFAGRFELRRGNFAELADWIAAGSCDGVLLDLGVSSPQLDSAERGFSFQNDGPLDMRMDDRQTLQAKDIVNEESAEELARIIYTYGEERGSRRIARLIVEARRRGPIATTGELRAIVERALGAHRRGGAHPATRTFQALRIAVNHEMESLAALLRDGPAMLNPDGRMLVISYHSLEDRPVKERFRELARAGGYDAISRKVIKPSSAETSRNPRARSAKVRCIERSSR